ncbi:MAG: hypothetical protein R3F36_12630 [Candidatus Competibacteraceae bacterium]
MRFRRDPAGRAKVTSRNGPASARNIPIPPRLLGREQLQFTKAGEPGGRPITSDGVITPGSKGNPVSRAASISTGVRPGLTQTQAPASRASVKSSLAE